MKTNRKMGAALALALLSTINPQPSTAHAQGTAFTYQGRLDSSGTPYTGLAEIQFSLWDAASGGSQLGSTLTVSPVGVSNGLFTVSLDFGDQFPGAARWLQIALRTNLLGFVTLSPRQPLTSAPYAIRAANAGAAATATTASGVTANAVGTAGLQDSSVTSAKIADGTITAADMDAASFHTTFWRAAGNAGTTPGTHFLGTTDNQPLEVRVNNQRALRLEPNTNNAPNVIGGYAGNFVSNGVFGATIGGGGAGNYLGIALTNRVIADFGTVSGGFQNTASEVGATVGGGHKNTASGQYATVGGGSYNIASGYFATVGGGDQNSANGWYSTVGGGVYNTASNFNATVGGGISNTAGGSYATVGGGWTNTASGESATVGGGAFNIASGWYATIGGGYSNSASGEYSFAAGRNALAQHPRSFVWSSYTNASPSFGSNTFFVNAPNGLGINCGAQRLDGGGQYWMNFGRIASGGQLIETSVGASLTLGGVWQNASDRHRKTDFAEVDGRAVLEKVLALPVRQWRYTNEAAGVKHLGPTAQDFRAAFGLGTDEQSIGTVDADGVALAAIQGLNQKLEARSQELGDRSQGVEARMRRLEAALKEREAENARLREAVTELQALVRALAAQDNERAR